MLSVATSRAARLAAGSSLALLLAACGSAPPSAGTQPEVTGTSTAAPAASPTAAPSTGRFPLRIRRVGGLAGMQDLITVNADGTTVLQTRRRPARVCRLSPQVMARITAAVDAVDWASLPPPTTDPHLADQLFTTVSTPEGGPADIGEPALRELGDLAGDLLTSIGRPCG
ncbi:MAG TPA: hypothetical protein VFJ97_03840 [Dermatophilaceae bacterium]|nr:hypothetical protein [Dermatophilaceae bacterium]